MTTNYPAVAAAVYQACNHFDPYLPPLSTDLARAWGRLFERHRLTAEDLLAGVDKVYAEHGSGYRPLPKDIVDAARAIRRDRDDRTGPTADYQALCEAKQGPESPRMLRLIQASGIGLADQLHRDLEAAGHAKTAELVERQRRAAPPQPIEDGQ